jgi:Asp/Glu/hydantoin racemase
VLGHFQEPGLLEIRGSLDIPVIGLGESNLLAALSLGYRFGLVTIDRSSSPGTTVSYGPTAWPIAMSALRR